MWWKEIVLLIALLCAPFSDGATQFELKFLHSTNKVIVTDYYYMLEYSVIKGTQRDTMRIAMEKVYNHITLNVQMIAKFNQSLWEPVQVDLSRRNAHRKDSFYQVVVTISNLPLKLMNRIIRNLASVERISGEVKVGDIVVDIKWHLSGLLCKL